MIRASRTKGLFLIPVLLLLLSTRGGIAQTEDGGVEGVFDFGTGADMVGVGQAGIARPSESSALYWNPAFLDRVQVANANFFHTSFLGDTPYDFFSVTYPTLHIGTFGVGVFRISTGDIQGTDAFGVSTVPFSYSQYQYLFSYGRRTDFLLKDSSIGFDFKIDNQQMLNESATGMGMDVAYHQQLDELSPLLEGVNFGLVMRNLLAPSLQLSREKESYARVLAFGIASSFELFEGHIITPMFDLEKSFKRYWKTKLGVEYDYLSFIRFRFGINTSSFATGMGFQYKAFNFDYAMRQSDYMTNHLISLSYRFGKTRDQMRMDEVEVDREKVEREAGEQLDRQRYEETQRRMEEAERLYNEGDYFAALGEWQGVLAWDENNETAIATIQKITEELNRQEEERSEGIANRAAVRELFEAGIQSYTQQRYLDAINSWTRVLEIDPEHELSREYIDRASEEIGTVVQQHLSRASAFERVGDYASALNELHVALRYEGEDQDIERRIGRCQNRIRSNDRFRRGLSLYLSGDYESALEDFKGAQGLNPANAMIAEYIGLTETKMAGYTTEIQPEMERVYLQGVDLYLQGQYQEAIAIWEQVLEEDPYNTKVQRNINEARERIEALNNLQNK